MKSGFLILFFLAACVDTPAQTIYAPVPITVPVAVGCKIPNFEKQPDFMAALARDATLAQFTKACAVQTLLDKTRIEELSAVLHTCSETSTKE